MAEVKVGRNDPCPCGSGKKYKRCCFARTGQAASLSVEKLSAFPPEVAAQIKEAQERDVRRRQEYGDIPSIVSTKYMDNRVVGVGNRLYFSKRWNTFADFLCEYALQLFGKEWYESETVKPVEGRHTARRWHDALVTLTRGVSPDPDGRYRYALDGYSEAYLLLAYELYVLRNLHRLQERMLDRLRDPGQFQGARYELFVAATCCKAGMDVEYEDESDKASRHPEFTARVRETGEVLQVEAKSRLWSGFSDDPEADEAKLVDNHYVRRTVRRLLKRALDKPFTKPYVVFLDLNLPSMSRKAFGEPWLKTALDTVVRTAGNPHDTKTKFNLLILTNFTLGFGDLPSAGGAQSYYGMVSPNPQIPVRSQILFRCYDAVRLRRQIPTDFPND